MNLNYENYYKMKQILDNLMDVNIIFFSVGIVYQFLTILLHYLFVFFVQLLANEAKRIKYNVCFMFSIIFNILLLTW